MTPDMPPPPAPIRSELMLHDLAKGTSRCILASDRLIDAPTFAPGGDWILLNADGALLRLDLPAGGELVPLPMGGITRCNNDHGFNPVTGEIAFSAHHRGLGAEIHVMAPDGSSAPRRLDLPPRSWWHGFSPDGTCMVYAAARGEGRNVDIYSQASGQAERRLTLDMGHCDGPDFSADGQSIYFNCDHGGHAQIWIMTRDGQGARPLFKDDKVNWFPHPSPDGRQLAYLAYPPGTQGHPRDCDVELILCGPDGSDRRPIERFLGGQGSLNVPCWAPDGQSLAYMRYRPVSPPME